MLRTWLSLALALCLLLPTMNVNAGETSNEHFFSLNGKIIDCNKDGYGDMFIITYDPDSDGDQDIDIRVDLDVFDSYDDAIDSVSGYHTINNGDADSYSLYWAASGSDTYDFYVGLYDDLGDLQDDHGFSGYPLESGSDCGDEFVCDNGGTVPFRWVDDDFDDCGDGSDEGESGGGDDDFVCDNGNTIPADYYDDGWDDCGDGSDEPNGVDSGDDGDEDTFNFGLPTGQLGYLLDELDTGNLADVNEDISVNFITPHSAEIETSAAINLDSDMSDTLREDIILASKMSEIEAYFAEGKTAIITDYAMGETDDEETLEALFSLYENATTSAVPDYTIDNDGNDDFICGDGEEIPFSWINDGWEDCEDGSDEQQYDDDGDKMYWFYCGEDYWILLDQVNDGWVDCPDGTDEANDNDDFDFNTAEDIREFVEFDDVIITQQHLDTYYDVAWDDGMNNMLTMDLTLSFGIIIMFIAAFSDDFDQDMANASFAAMILTSITICPETPDGFGVLGCVMNQYELAATELFGEGFMEYEEDDADMGTYCLDSTNQILTDTGAGTASCSADTTMVFYNMSEDEMSGLAMDDVNSVDDMGLMEQPGGFPLIMPDVTMSIVDTENVLGKFSDNVGKEASIEVGMKFTVFFPGVSAGDSHTFVIDPDINEEIFENVATVQVSPPSGYILGEESADGSVTITSEEGPMTWTFIKSGEADETANETAKEPKDSGLPGPGLLIVILTIFGVASVRRRF